MVSGIVVEKEQIGSNRYIASLGVLFDRARTGQLLGVRASAVRSPPLLVLPIIWNGGTARVFEDRTEWQKAWARFRTGDSAIDYVRAIRSEEHTSELQSLMRISYAVFCLKKKEKTPHH